VNLSEQEIRDIQVISEGVVNLLNELGLDARVGKSQGVPYPSVREGAWSVYLMWDHGAGWTCQAYERIGPHWHWFISSNIENFGSSYASGFSAALLSQPNNWELMSYMIRFILIDPCRIPYAFSTPEFKCPECSGDWGIAQKEEGVFGKFATPLIPLMTTPGSFDPDDWNLESVKIAFGPTHGN